MARQAIACISEAYLPSFPKKETRAHSFLEFGNRDGKGGLCDPHAFRRFGEAACFDDG